MSPRALLRIAIAVVMLAPLIILISASGLPDLPPAGQLVATIQISFLQSLLSTGGSLVVGMVGALGLCAVPVSKRLTFLEAFVLIPTWMPPLFVILSSLSIVTRWTTFPLGLGGVVLVHTVMNSGLVAVAVSRLLRARLGGQVELAWLEGAGRWQFLREGVWPQIRREVGLIAVVVFGMCFTSFAVPLIVGGVRATTLEVFVYQQLHSGRGLALAVGVGLVQMLILSLLAVWASGGSAATFAATRNLKFIAAKWALLIPMSISLLLLVGSGWDWLLGFSQMAAWPAFQDAFGHSLWNTLIVSLGVGAMVVTLIAACAFALPHEAFRRWLLGYSMPSTVLVGIALMVIGPSTGPMILVKITVGLSLILFPPLYRWLGDGAIHALRPQVLVARTLGASWGLIWGRIVIPQLARDLGLIGALAAIWASGDFALSALVAYQDVTLAMLVDEMMSSYRLELATWLLAPLLAVGFGTGLVFFGVGYVTSRRLSSGLR